MDFLKELTPVVLVIIVVVLGLLSFIFRKKLVASEDKMNAIAQIDNSHSIVDKNLMIFKGWLNNIITNTYYDFVRKHKRTPETISIDYTCEPLDIQFKIELPDKKVKPIEKCISSECEKFIKEAIKNLPESFRIAIILREFQGLSYEEIAQTTNSSIGTVKSRISRARIKLQEALKNYI